MAILYGSIKFSQDGRVLTDNECTCERFSSRSFVRMLGWLQEGLSGGMTQNTSSSVTHIDDVERDPKMNKKNSRRPAPL